MRELARVRKDADGSYELEIVRTLDASLSEAWEVLTERDSLEGWLGRARYEPRVGSALTIDFGGGDSIRGEVVAIDPPRRFAFTWSEDEATEESSLVSLELVEVAGGTRLTLTHSRQPLSMARRTAAGWHAHMDLLIGFMHGTTPEWESVYPPAREAYASLVASLT